MKPLNNLTCPECNWSGALNDKTKFRLMGRQNRRLVAECANCEARLAYRDPSSLRFFLALFCLFSLVISPVAIMWFLFMLDNRPRVIRVVASGKPGRFVPSEQRDWKKTIRTTVGRARRSLVVTVAGSKSRRIVTLIVLLVGVYIVSCLNNTILLNRMLSPLAEQFEETAKSSDLTVVRRDSEGAMLDYKGQLDRIIRTRNRILESNYGISLGAWKAYMGDYGLVEVSLSWAFCYNPFHRI